MDVQVICDGVLGFSPEVDRLYCEDQTKMSALSFFLKSDLIALITALFDSILSILHCLPLIYIICISVIKMYCTFLNWKQIHQLHN